MLLVVHRVRRTKLLELPAIENAIVLLLLRRARRRKLLLELLVIETATVLLLERRARRRKRMELLAIEDCHWCCCCNVYQYQFDIMVK